MGNFEWYSMGEERGFLQPLTTSEIGSFHSNGLRLSFVESNMGRRESQLAPLHRLTERLCTKHL